MSADRLALVAGAAGFIGCHLVRGLLSRGCSVKAMVRPEGRRLPRDIAGQAEQVEVDLDSGPIPPKILEDVQVVYNLTGKYLPGKSGSLLGPLRRINAGYSRKLIEAAVLGGVRRFIHVSSIAACESGETVEIDEEGGLATSAYGISKREGEELVKSIGANRIEWTVFRPALVFGEGQMGPILSLARAIQAGRFFLLGDGSNHVNLLHAGDLSSLLIEAETMRVSHGKTYIVADHPLRFRKLIELIREELGVTAPIRSMPKWLGAAAAMMCDAVSFMTGAKFPLTFRSVKFMTRDVIYKADRLRGDTGLSPSPGVEAGLRRTLEWYRAKGLL